MWSNTVYILSLMFVPCIIRRSRYNQHYALICTTPLFYILAPTCFGISMPSSGSILDPSELLEIQIEWVVYHIMCGYETCVPDCRGSVCRASCFICVVVIPSYVFRRLHRAIFRLVPRDIEYNCTRSRNLTPYDCIQCLLVQAWRGVYVRAETCSLG
jgi:hypothetical protein